MPVKNDDQKVVDALFKAMQMGPDGEEAMMELFAENATFIEPFMDRPAERPSQFCTASTSRSKSPTWAVTTGTGGRSTPMR